MMPKQDKTKLSKMSASKWTSFFRNLDVVTRKRNTFLKNYNPRKDFNALKKKGISEPVIQKVYTGCLKYDALLFNKLSRFFRYDPETVKVWAEVQTNEKAFLKLFNIIHKGNFESAKKRFLEIDLIFKFFKKGEGRRYFATHYTGSINALNPRNLIRILNRRDPNSDYKNKGTVKLGKDRILCIEKKTSQAGQSIHKFIKLTPNRKRLEIILSMDSSKEYNLTIYALEKWFKTFIDAPQSHKSFRQLNRFLVMGDSKHFTLTGVTYFDNEFKLTISPAHGRIQNITGLSSYKKKIEEVKNKVETIFQIRIFSKDKSIINPVAVTFLGNRTAGIVGAINLVPNDKKLNTVKRANLFKNFQEDFGISLNEFLEYNDLKGIEIYRKFLENNPQRKDQIELRSNAAMSIYQSLLSDGLLATPSFTEEQAKFCANPSCPNKFKVIWDTRNCPSCGEILLNGKKIETQNIDETKVVEYLKNNFTAGTVTKHSNKLLRRNIYVARISYKKKEADVIPISAALTSNQIEIIKFRYPNLILITSKDNVAELAAQGLTALTLYELVYNLKASSGKSLQTAIEKSKEEFLTRTRNLCLISSSRITKDQFYKEKNKDFKNFGAELFEADCSIILNYIFGNCAWLGAKYRGKSVPDGLTAFPLLEKQEGCFIWDSKFSESKAVQMGGFTKNKTYIKDSKKNRSIIDNGGLKGFVFISNKKFPASFSKKYLSLIKGSRVKMTFLTALQLQKIVTHFKVNEAFLLNNLKARNVFIKSMQLLFFATTSNTKCIVISNTDIDTILAQNEIDYGTLPAGRPLAIN